MLAKVPKPGQDRRVDLPTIGVATLEGVAQAGLAGLVGEAGELLVVDPDGGQVHPAILAGLRDLGEHAATLARAAAGDGDAAGQHGVGAAVVLARQHLAVPRHGGLADISGADLARGGQGQADIRGVAPVRGDRAQRPLAQGQGLAGGADALDPETFLFEHAEDGAQQGVVSMLGGRHHAGQVAHGQQVRLQG